MLLFKTCNSAVYVVVMGLVLGQSLISTTGILLYVTVHAKRDHKSAK